jgi:hypothetical protein
MDVFYASASAASPLDGSGDDRLGLNSRGYFRGRSQNHSICFQNHNLHTRPQTFRQVRSPLKLMNTPLIFSNQGAVLTSFCLKNFENRQTHQPIELVNSDPESTFAFRFNLRTSARSKPKDVSGSRNF